MAETPFIDMAVHDDVRGPLLEGRATIVFGNGFSDVIWANGPAARLFGHASISGLLDQGMSEFISALRQLKASLDRSEDGNAKSMVRITSGQRSRLMPILLKRIGEDEVLVVFRDEEDLSETDALARMISGLQEDGAAAAVIDDAGDALVSDGPFGEFGLSTRQLAGLAADVASEDDRLVKRMVTAEGSGERIAVGVGRLRDEPLQCLILAVPTGEFDENARAAVSQDNFESAALADEQEDLFSVPDPVAEPGQAPFGDGGNEQSDVSDEEDGSETAAVETRDQAVFAFEPQRGPVRFVWKMDADGAFTEVSDEFSQAVGPLAADIVGKSFDDVSVAFGLDQSGDISASLKRRDTWSGKSVAWPIQDTDMRIPVDLAALPFYNRDRIFEGYRGFGIARLNEAHGDPDATGLTLRGADAMTTDADAHDETVLEQSFAGVRERPLMPADDLPHDLPHDLPDFDNSETIGDPFRGEVPALHSATITPFRRASDASSPDEPAPVESKPKSLDDSEADAFRKIGEALGGSVTTHPDIDTLDEGDDPLEVYYNHMDGLEEEPLAVAADEDAAEDRDPYPVTSEAESVSDDAAKDDDALSDDAPDDQAVAAETRSDIATDRIQNPKSLGRLIGRSLLGDETDKVSSSDDDDGKESHALPGYSLDENNDDEPAAMPSTRQREFIDDRASIDMSDIITDEPDDGDIHDNDDLSADDLPYQTDLETETARDFDWRDHQDPDSGADDFPDEMTDVPETRSSSRDDFDRPDFSREHHDAIRRGLTPDALDGLPLPLLIVRGETALFANTSFQIMTGYDTIDDLNLRGGVDALFAGHDDGDFNAEAGHTVKRAMTLVASDGDHFPARAHMQIVPWEGCSALMFALEPVNRMPEETSPYVDSPALTLFDEDERPKRFQPRSDANGNEEFQGHVEELTAILDIATDGVVILSRNGTMQAINGPAAALFGYRQDELQDKSFSMLFAHESQRAALDYMASIAGSGVASLLNEGREVLGREKNGGFLPLFMTMGRLPQEGRMCAVLRDITPWKQTEQALQNAKRDAEKSSNSKSEFLAKISHEIRTPLNAIIGFSELMMEERFGPIGSERYVGYLTDINKSGRHVLDLINDLLDISKIEAGKQELSFEGVHLNEAVAEALSMVQPLATRERIIMRSSFDANLPDVVADLRSVKQIVLNLLSNAVRFTPAGGLVVASTSFTVDGGVVLRVKDTGIGMTPKEVDTAMQPFKQVADLGRKRGDGTGLGLPLTKALVEANRAEFTIHSEPGRGTVVEIHFPQARVLAD